MQSKKKNIPKYQLGGTLSSLGQAGLGLYQTKFGMTQRDLAKQTLEQLQRDNPGLQIPTSLRRLVSEPISESYMEAQEMGAQRRTSQAIDALSKGGSRTLGLIPSVLENERVGEQERAGQYEQARRNALKLMGGAEQNIQQMNWNKYLQDINAARESMGAGEQNIFGGLGQVTRGGVAMGDQISSDLQNAIPFFDDGGMIKTKGKFSHRRNPKDLIDRNTGEVEAELTGNEVVFNKKDSDTMEQLAKSNKGEKLSKFINGKFKKFRSKKKSK